MKKIIKSIALPLLLSTVFGYICARVVYGIYKENLDERLLSTKIYLLKNGEYLTYEQMRENNNYNNYIYYIDEQKYKSIIGITNDEDNISKIKKISSDNIEIEEYYISNGQINEKQKEYDIELKKTTDPKKVKEIVDNILNIYKENKSINLILTK